MELARFFISDEKSHEEALQRVDYLMDLNEGEGPEAGTDEGIELELLAMVIEKYEKVHFPIDLPSPVEAVVFALEQKGLLQVDLSKILNSRSRASELLNGNMTGLSRSMMQKLHRELDIPAEILIQDIPRVGCS